MNLLGFCNIYLRTFNHHISNFRGSFFHLFTIKNKDFTLEKNDFQWQFNRFI